jgi:cellulose synthase/poly-beta-1,6-N-acetylglucosamine synthase-like glycosyltransferase
VSGSFFAVLWPTLGTYLSLASLPGTLELALLTLGGSLPLRGRREPPLAPHVPPLRLAALIPAHDEAAGIARAVASLAACEEVSPYFSIVVVADNCSDATAERAREAGARVIVRHEPQRRGKGYALDLAFGILLAEGCEAVLVVDADTSVDAGLTAEVRALLAEGADGVQVEYRVRNPQDSLRTRLMNVALLAFNVLRPRGRERFGLSAGILGNGFALTRDTLTAVPYDAHSVVEDLEYHLRLVRAGRRVRFAAGTAVYADMPAAGRGVETQRARWEGGRLAIVVESVPTLVREVLSGNLRLLEPLGELLLLPLAFHVLLLLAVLGVPFAPARIYGLVGLLIVSLHVVAAVFAGGGGVRDLAALAAAPLYVAWKIGLAPAIARASRRRATWVRTERAGTAGRAG